MYDDTPGPRRSRRSRSSSSARKTPREISRLAPATVSQESIRHTNRRRSRAEKVMNPAGRRRRRKRMMIVGLWAVGLLMVASAIVAFAYVRGIGNKINAVTASDPALAKLLADGQPSEPGKPFYVALMGSDTRPGEKQQRTDSLMIARVDPQKKTVQMMSIPRDSRVEIPGHGMNKINAASVYGGPRLVIETLKELTGLPIAHYVNIDFRGFRDVVDAIGGVWIDVPKDINDRQASAFGRKYAKIKKGYQKLDGKRALTFVRTRHTFADGDFSRMRNQQAFIKALATQALSLSNVFKASSIVNAVASNMDTDLTPAQLADLVLQFKGMKAGSIDSINAPGDSKYVDGQSFVVLDEEELTAVLDRMKRGEPLDPSKETTATPGQKVENTVKPGDVKLTVRNGAGVSGLGKQCTDFLKSKGFKVPETGNMAKYVYGRTLIVFKTGNEAKANFVRETLGFGDVIPAAGMYAFETPVMVVIGKDWKNPNESGE